jgi:KipI family sensor histidine kinase inhibitor
MKAELFGDRSILITDVDSPVELLDAIRSSLPSMRVRAGIDALLIEGLTPDPSLQSQLVKVEAIVNSAARVERATDADETRIAVRYDGPDLEFAAQQLKTTIDDVIARHQQTRWRVAMLGFAPGFPYLLPITAELWDVERLATPRSRVPAGSVAIAAGMSAIYPTAMPGGWLLLGTTDFSLFDAEAMPPATLQPGAVVRFCSTA